MRRLLSLALLFLASVAGSITLSWLLGNVSPILGAAALVVGIVAGGCATGHLLWGHLELQDKAAREEQARQAVARLEAWRAAHTH